MGYHYLPYASGLLQAYVLRHAPILSRYTFLPFIFDRQPLEVYRPGLAMADVLAFSAYGWNLEYSLALARLAKTLKPQILTLFGGPQIPERAEAFLRAHPEVDLCCHGEGEQTFLSILESLPHCDWSEISGISWLDAEGVFHTHPQGPRLRELELIPSPYLLGLYDQLLAQQSFHWVAPWETNRGCPFGCSFCDWGSATASKVHFFGMERLKQEFEWFARHKIDIVNCNDANFGMFKRDLEIAEFCVQIKQQTAYPHILFVQGSKNINEQVYQAQKKLIDAGLCDLVTMDLLSTTPAALASVERENISATSYGQWQQRIQREGLNSYTNLMIGLPEESYDDFAQSMDRVLSQGQHHLVHFFNSYVLPNAPATNPEYQARYGIETVKGPYYEPTHPLQSEIQEWQEMVIATQALPRSDWRRARVLAWWVEVLHLLRKPMQLPVLMLHLLGGLSFRQIFEFYADERLAPQRYQGLAMLQALQSFFEHKALAIQNGEHEACALSTGPQPQWLTVPDFVSAGLQPDHLRKAFYAEQQILLERLLVHYRVSLPPELLTQAIGLADALFKGFIQQRPFRYRLSYNLWEVSQAYLKGEPWQLQEGRFEYVHDWLGPPFYALRPAFVASI